MVKLNIAMIAYVVISLVAIGVLAGLYMKCKKKEDGFCNCTGIGNRVCPNLPLLHKMYNDGKLTEFTDRSKNPRHWQEMGWDKFTPYKAGPRGCQ